MFQYIHCFNTYVLFAHLFLPFYYHYHYTTGEYADTRHVGQLKVLLEQLLSNELPTDK